LLLGVVVVGKTELMVVSAGLVNVATTVVAEGGHGDGIPLNFEGKGTTELV